MTLNNKQKPIIALILAVVLIASVIALGKKSDDATPDTASQTTAATDVAVPTPATETSAATARAEVEEARAEAPALSPDGLYTAECLVSGGTMFGEVEVDEGDDPAKQKSIDIKNMNTGKSTKIDMATARCTFTPKS